jgi:hypothetical protein
MSGSPPRPPFKAVLTPRQAPPRGDERPGCLTAVCLFLGFGVVVWLGLAFADTGTRGKWYPAHLVVQALGIAAVIAGLWRMRKWSVVAFATVALLVQVLYLFTGLLNMETFLIYAFTLGPAIYYYKRMK